MASEQSPSGLYQQVLDVRPILQSGVDPFDTIVAALGRMNAHGLLALIAPFRPEPLLRYLREEGHSPEVELLAQDVYQVLIPGKRAVAPMDLRDLEAPLPLERVLASTARLGAGEGAHFVMPRVPRLLFPRLIERGHECACHEHEDGSAMLTVWCPG